MAAIHGSHPAGRRCATLKIAPDDFLWLFHPWSPPYGSLLRDVKNRSLRFFMALHPWPSPCGSSLRGVENNSRRFFIP
jgi:hypothetical protein